MPEIVSTYEKYIDKVCDTYLDYVDLLSDAYASAPLDDDLLENIKIFRTARVNAFRYWNGDVTASGASGEVGHDAGGGDETLTKIQKQQQRLERLQKAKKALQGISSSSAMAGEGAGPGTGVGDIGGV